MQFITPSMMSRMASTLGLDRDDVQKAIGVGVPAILAGFANVGHESPTADSNCPMPWRSNPEFSIN